MYLSYQEFLYLITSVSLLFITFFLCWALYQLTVTLRNANDILTDTKDKIDRVEGAVSAFTEKVGNITSYLGFIVEGARHLLGYLRKDDSDRDEGKRITSRKTKKTLSDWL